MTRKEILRKIDEMVIYEKDYRIIEMLLDGTSEKFFVKVLEEIFSGNLFFSDFETIFKDGSYETMIRQNLEIEEKLQKEIERTIAFRREMDSTFSINPSTTRLGITLPDETDVVYDYYQEIKNETLQRSISQLFNSLPGDTDLVKASKLRVWNALQNGDISEEDFLLFAKEYVVPLSPEYQVLDQFDLDFMFQNNLTEDEVKKLKALALFVRRNDSI